MPRKQSKRSTVSETEESTDSDESEESEDKESEEEPALQADPGPMVPTESPILKHRRRKLEIKTGKSSKEK